jgi:hypothetical protein
VTAEPVLNSTPNAAPSWRAVVDVLLVWLVLAGDGAWPIPDVNEAHYLTKARHFWEPDWIANDLFLNSRDSHVVFFTTFGGLAHVLPLPTAALVGRLLQWLCLAWGWRRLSYAVAPRFGLAALTAAGAVALGERGHMAGEWIVGGFEAKAFAYALVFSALADLIAGRWNRALGQLGAATALHVLVGGWSLAAVGAAWLALGRPRPSLRSMAPGLIVAASFAAIGLVPALALQRGVDVATRALADQIYVFARLGHHLVPQQFAPEFVARHLVLWGLWIAACYARPAGPLGLVRRFVAAAGLIAGVGLVIAFAFPEPSARGAALLRFYWFRLSDVAPALGLALELGAAALSATRTTRRFAYAALAVVGVLHLGAVQVERWQAPLGRGERLAYPENLAPWRDVCAWIRTHTPREALFLTPRQFYTFKWYAERADVAIWKDIPQDAAGIVAWQQRLEAIYGAEHSWFNFMPLDRVKSLARRYDIDYLVAYREPSLALPVAYSNNDFVVYELNAAVRENASSP